MSDSSRSTTESSAAAERLLSALGAAASGLGARETLTGLGDRARGVVEDLARHARARREAASAARNDDPAGGQGRTRTARPDGSASDASSVSAAFPELHRRLDELRACVGEVADVLDATLERLETIEAQLGDPEAGFEGLLRDGVERCERVLLGIEHRVLGAMAGRGTPASDGNDDAGMEPAGFLHPAAPFSVLVVAASSRHRARLCVALERQRLPVIAATSFATAVAACERSMPDVALLAIEGTHEASATFLEEWKDGQESGRLPRALLLDAASAAAAFGFTIIREQHGEAAMAASLVGLARTVGERTVTAERQGERTNR